MVATRWLPSGPTQVRRLETKLAVNFMCDQHRALFELGIDMIKADKYLSTHANFFIKEMRLVAYRQYLESFKSVTIENMAKSFGVSADFIDRELSNFIYIGRINCKIDKVSGVIETNRPNRKAELFQNNIKQGDHLLNRVQKLARALDI